MREYDDRRQDNAYLLNEIARHYHDGDAANVGGVDRQPELIAALSADAIQAAAAKYLDTSRYVKVTLVPEGR
jgi:predicted Zn-dependent peptidase